MPKKIFKGAEEYGYIVALPRGETIFVVADNIAGAIDRCDELGLEFCGFEHHQSIRIVR